MVAFLASDKSAYTTGTIITIDGGAANRADVLTDVCPEANSSTGKHEPARQRRCRHRGERWHRFRHRAPTGEGGLQGGGRLQQPCRWCRELAAELPGSGHRTARMPMEDTAVLREVATMVEREYGRCDVLVNSAGFTRMIPHADLEALTDELIDAIFVANVRGPFAMIRAFAPLMKRSDAAVIINISSAAAFSGGGSNIAYGGSKAAVDTMTKSLARVLGPNVRVLSVSPGAVDTGFRARTHDRDGRTRGATHAAEASGSG